MTLLKAKHDTNFQLSCKVGQKAKSCNFEAMCVTRRGSVGTCFLTCAKSSLPPD